ncbi:MAG: DUF4230 domain-containing protein [Bacteroidota bacterium]
MHQIQGASQIATVEYVISKVVIGKKEQKLLGYSLSEADYLAEAEARVKAGIDLAKISEENIRIQDNFIHLSLPPVEIINFSFPAGEAKVNEDYTEDGWLAIIEGADIDRFYQEAELSVRKDIVNMGLEEAAQDKTKKFLMKFLLQAGYDSIQIDFEKFRWEPNPLNTGNIPQANG